MADAKTDSDMPPVPAVDRPTKDADAWRPVETRQRPVITPKTLFILLAILIALGLGLAVASVPLPVIAGVFATLLFGVFVLLYPFAGLMGYFIVMLVRPQEVWTTFGGQLPIERALALLILLATAVRPRFLRHNKVVWSPISTAVIAFALVLGSSVGFAVWRSYAMTQFMEFTKVVVVYILITQLVTTPRRLVAAVAVFLACHMWIAGSTIYTFYTAPAYVRMGIQRAHAMAVTLSDPNAVAASLAYAAPFAIYLLPHVKRWWSKLGLAVYLGIAVFCTVFTGSRSGMLTFIVLAMIIAWRSRRRIPAMIAAVTILLSIWSVMPKQYQDRFRTIYTHVPDQYEAGATDSALGRWRGFRLGVKMLIDRPLLGVGVGCFAPAWFAVYTIDGQHSWSQAHNMVAQLVAESGILGLAAYAAFTWLFCREYLRIRRRLGGKRNIRRTPVGAVADACFVAYILLWFNGLFGHNLYRYNWFMFAGYLAVSCLMVREAARLSTASISAGTSLEVAPDVVPAPAAAQ